MDQLCKYRGLSQNVKKLSIDSIFFDKFCQNIKSFCKQTAMLRIHWKPDRNWQELTVCLGLWISIWIHSRTLCFTCPRSMLQVLHRATLWNNLRMCILFCYSATFLWDLFSLIVIFVKWMFRQIKAPSETISTQCVL